MADSAEEDVYMLQKTREVLTDLRKKCTEKSKDSTQYNYAYHLHKAIEHMDYAIAERAGEQHNKAVSPQTSPMTKSVIIQVDEERLGWFDGFASSLEEGAIVLQINGDALARILSEKLARDMRRYL